MTSEPVTLLPVDSGAYAMLLLVRDEHGRVTDVLPSPILAFTLGANGLSGMLTLRGIVPLGGVAVWGPDGSVELGQRIWPDAQTYINWIKQQALQ